MRCRIAISREMIMISNKWSSQAFRYCYGRHATSMLWNGITLEYDFFLHTTRTLTLYQEIANLLNSMDLLRVRRLIVVQSSSKKAQFKCKFELEARSFRNFGSWNVVRCAANKTIQRYINTLRSYTNNMILIHQMFHFIGHFANRLANKKVYVLLYGFIGCVYGSSYAYFNGTITTLEKRYKIPSRNTGIISVGNDISQLLVSAVLSYYAGKGHRPRWMALGTFKFVWLSSECFFWHALLVLGLTTIVAFCILNMFPHYLYGPGADALALTVEYGAQFDENSTLEMFEREKRNILCSSGKNMNGLFIPLLIGHTHMFHASFHPQQVQTINVQRGIMHFGRHRYFCLPHNSYRALDNRCIPHSAFRIWTTTFRNRKHRHLSVSTSTIRTYRLHQFCMCFANIQCAGLSMFMRMLAPALGYTLASMSLKFYISPSLTPTINDLDPRWLGAWWVGWAFLAILLTPLTLFLGNISFWPITFIEVELITSHWSNFLCSSTAMFPKTLPRAAVRRTIQNEKNRREMTKVEPIQEKASLRGKPKCYLNADQNDWAAESHIFILLFCFWRYDDDIQTFAWECNIHLQQCVFAILLFRVHALLDFHRQIYWNAISSVRIGIEVCGFLLTPSINGL